MRDFLQFTATGVTLGSVLALLAFGWVIIYRVSGIVNLAQGSFLVMPALLAAHLSGRGAAVYAAIAAAIVFGVALAVGVDLALLRPVRQRTFVAPILITLGASEVLAEVSRMLWGNEPLRMSPFLPTNPVSIGGAMVQYHAILLIGTCFVLFVCLWFLFQRTLIGQAFRACAVNAEGARLVGINPLRMRTAAFALAGGLGALGGCLIVPLAPVGWEQGLHLGIRGLIAAVLGSWSYPGAVVGGLALGLGETYAAGYVSSSAKDLLTLGALVVVLLLRPQGLWSLFQPAQELEAHH